ncbi:MAG: efflux RND transporter periplasmic adaptor subunit [Gammaproteobacteria bacterium]
MKLHPFSLIAGCLLLFNAPPVVAAEKPVPVTVVKAVKAPVYDDIPLTGTVESRRVSRLSPKLSGYVAEVLVDDGDVVSAGDPLLHLDPVMAEIELNRIRAEIREAEVRLAEAKRQHNEASELVEKKHIPATNYEALVSEVAIAEAVLQRLQTDLERQRETLRRHTIRAPYNGVIGEKLVEAGQWVETGSALFQLVETDILRITIPVPQYYFSRIRAGTPARVRFDALPDYTLDAEVTMKIPVGSESGRTFPVRIEMKNEDGRVAPGMSARVRLRLQDSGGEEALLLPRDSLVLKPDGTSTAWIVDGGDVLTARPVTVRTGRSFRGNVEILEGEVRPGDRVVVRGNEILEPGQPVRVHRRLDMEL